jgi:hypothetical protein
LLLQVPLEQRLPAQHGSVDAPQATHCVPAALQPNGSPHQKFVPLSLLQQG